ncbi:MULTISPECIES: sodium:solute symporter family transporter [Vibrio]|uniref:sodium:solute symporter family transporter n=1 Tax=Vibrio TaxID=662 RepID=UPI00211A3FF2|nr:MULTISPECIES: sodium/solute symporter [Vibrio]EKO3841882.1 sodium/solute symporter [Vibrio harveyi]MCQ9084965.1 sodium/solute symporter [Vibrio harveyi]MDA0123752.1 sodium/solute symporter [Vibrio sp. MM46]
MGILDITVALAFMIAVIGVGMIKSKPATNGANSDNGAADYFLAGRGLSWWLIGFSLIAANISAEQFVGMSGQGAGLEGLSVASWEWIAAITLVVVAFVLLPYFLKTGITTIPEFLEVRYNHWARLAMTLSMILILVGVSLVGVIYAGAITMTKLFAEFGYFVSLPFACWILGGMAALYVAFGGLKACAWADLLQGTALIVGGAIITYFAFDALGAVDVSQLVSSTGNAAHINSDAGVLTKFNALNSESMHMDTPAMPWPVLLLGIWIPNFYYWGLNQYITQRILGSASLGDGQKGLVLAAGLKLIIPFIIVIPGIIAFNLFSSDMEASANLDAGGSVFSSYEQAVSDIDTNKVFILDSKYANSHPNKAEEILEHNQQVVARLGEGNVVKEAINPYKYDSAMGLLITKLIPKNTGVLGFVIAALMGAIISSLAAVLNAASTLLTMDVYQRYIRPAAAQGEYVKFGRICIGVFVVIGCVVAPMLAEFKSIFGFIQSFQGYVSTGILAVFIYGLINRTSGKWAGVIGIVANAIIYAFMQANYPHIHFLYNMSYCLIAVLAILTVYGMIFKEERVEFKSNTTLDMTPSQAALKWGGLVCALTVILYIVFW